VPTRSRAVAIARHLRQSERLSLAQIGQRLGRSPATVKGYFYDPTGDKVSSPVEMWAGCAGRKVGHLVGWWGWSTSR
jgi:AraC-like DNA-binding protein